MKKTILILTLFMLTLSVLGQQTRKWRGNYLLSGLVEHMSSGKAVLTYENATKRSVKQEIKEAAISNGKFAFTDYIEEPILATLTIDEKEYTFYIDPTNVQIEINANGDIEVKNSWTNNDKVQVEQLKDRINSLADNSANKAQGDLAELSYASLVKDSFVVLKKIQGVIDSNATSQSESINHQMINIFMAMPEALKNTPSGLRTSEKLFLLSVKMHKPQN